MEAKVIPIRPDVETLPTSRKEALRLGTQFYLTGKLCRYGHISERFTKNGVCRECNRGVQHRTHSKQIEEYGSMANYRKYIDFRRALNALDAVDERFDKWLKNKYGINITIEYDGYTGETSKMLKNLSREVHIWHGATKTEVFISDSDFWIKRY